MDDMRLLIANWFGAGGAGDEPAALVAPLLRFNRVPDMPTVDGAVEVLVVENQGVWLWGRDGDGSYVERENIPGRSWRPTGEGEVEFWLHHAAFEAVWSMPAQRSSLAVDGTVVERILAGTDPLPCGEWMWPADGQRIQQRGRSLVMFCKDGDGWWVLAGGPSEGDLEWLDNRGAIWEETDTRGL